MKRVLYFNVTYRCSQCCQFCFSHNTNSDCGKQNIEVDEFSQILNEQAVKGGDRIIINGGEPTLHPRLSELLNAAVATGAEIVIYSNGVTFADIEYCNKVLTPRLGRVTIPVHGSRNVHDRVTGLVGAHDKVVEALKNIMKLGFSKSLELKFIMSNEMVKSGFSPAVFVREHIGDSKLASVVVTGQVNTRQAHRNRCILNQDEEYLRYVANEVMRLRDDIPVKLYDVELCKASSEFLGWIDEHKLIGNEPEFQYVFFDAEKLRGKRMAYRSFRSEKRCNECRFKRICRSIADGYNVISFLGKNMQIVME